MEPVGTFQAQYFKWFSADPNTIFQFVVFPDRIFLLKIGSALNQIPQILSRWVDGPVGLRSYANGATPAVDQLRQMVDNINNKKTLGMTSASLRSRELPLNEIASVEHRRSGMFGRGLHVRLRTGKKLFFRFLQPQSAAAAEKALADVLKDRFVSC